MVGVSNMQTIYVITKGSYSDYHICAATTDKKRAERLRDLFYNDGSMYPDDVNIEEFRDGTYNDMIDRGYKAYEIYFNANYELKSVRLESLLFLSYTDDNEWNVIRECGNKNVPLPYRVCVQARDEAHARKMAQDIMAEYKYKKEIDEKSQFDSEV